MNAAETAWYKNAVHFYEEFVMCFFVGGETDTTSSTTTFDTET